MSIFNNMFGNGQKSNSSRIDWQYLTEKEQLSELAAHSNERPVIIFKHSTRCNISRMALRTFENEYDLHDKVTPYFLDLLENRDISNEVASKFNVVHHSPQLLLIKDGAAVYDASHDGIDVERLKKHL